MAYLLRQTLLHQEPDLFCLRHFGGVSGISEDWGTSLGEARQVFCLNLGGDLMIFSSNNRQHLVAGTMGMFQVEAGLKATTMLTSERAFNFLVVEISYEWIGTHFAVGLDSLSVEKAAVWKGKGQQRPLSARILSTKERSFCAEIVSPPVDGVAREYWYAAKVLEFLSLQIFRENTLPFCTSQKTATRDRVAKTLSQLHDHLDEPLDLHALAELANVSPATLSRLVSLETGMTLSRHLRAMRIARATELIRDDGYNVTSAAVEVGYSSLSHFTKAFFEETGQKPSEFL